MENSIEFNELEFNLYELLNIPINSSQDEIKKSFKRLIKKFHPDKITKINYATENFDTNNNYASSRFTPTVAGYYQISASTRLGSITASLVVWAIYKNGSSGATGGGCGVVAGYVYPAISSLIYLNGSTDYVELYTFNTSGGVAITGLYGYTCFSGSLVRGA